MTEPLAIETTALTRTFKFRTAKGERKTIQALAGVDLQVRQGELFGLLGPNGAGKTTLIKILTTLLAPTTGNASILGHDVVHDYGRIRPVINMVAGGESTGYGLLTVREQLWMFAQFYGIDGKTTRERSDELLAVVGLTEQANTKISNLSTGMRQRMNLARGLLTNPQIFFLDEPTRGLDVGAARDVRNYIKKWTAQPGKTTLLTTHYMVEADELCDRVAIIDKGRVLACDSPATLKRQLQRDVIFEMRVSGRASIGNLPGIRKTTIQVHDGYSDLTVILDESNAISQVVSTLSDQGASILNLVRREPTLEDVFLELYFQRSLTAVLV